MILVHKSQLGSLLRLFFSNDSLSLFSHNLAALENSWFLVDDASEVSGNKRELSLTIERVID